MTTGHDISLGSLCRCIAILLVCTCARAEGRTTLRTNLLYWMTATPNIGVDVSLSRHFSLSGDFGYNAFNFPNYTTADGADANPKLHHWMLRGEGKFWFRQTFRGAYIGMHVLGGQYNAGGIKPVHFLRNYRYEGWGAGAGLSFGYRFALGRNWGIEASLGASVLHLDYTKYDCGSCGKRRYSRQRTVFAPTKAEISISYAFGTRSRVEPVVEESFTGLETVTADPIVESIAADTVQPEVVTEVVDAQTVELPVAKPDTACFIIRFPVDDARFLPKFASNPAELCRMHSFVDSIAAAGVKIESVQFVGYASPEYDADHNSRLSERRATSVVTGVLAEFGLAEVPVSFSGVGDDWEGLCRVLGGYDSDLSSAVVEMIRSRRSAPQLKADIKLIDSGRLYRKLLADVYPSLRRVEIRIIYLPE